MVSAASVKDRETLEAWLKGQSREVCVLIAHRAAMRVAPILWSRPRRGKDKDDLTTLPVQRANLLTGVAARTPTFANSAAVTKAADAARAAATAISAYAASCAAATAAANAAYGAADTVDYVSYAADAADSADVWSAVRADAQMLARDDLPRDLWDGKNSMQSQWASARKRWRTAGWDFWIDWYEDALTGREPDWTLLEQVALIDPAIWDAGAEAVNAEIDRLRTERALEKSDNAERVEVNPDTGRLFLVSESLLPDDIGKYARRKMEKALELFGDAPANQYTGLSPVFRVLRSALDDAANMPVELFDACASASRLTVRLGDQGACPTPAQDALVEDFLTRIRAAGADILAHDPKTQQVLERRNAITGNDALIVGRELIVAAAAEVANVAEGRLAEVLPEDAALATDPAADPEERKVASYRLGGRLLRVWKAVARFGRGVGAVIDRAKKIQELVEAMQSSSLVKEAIRLFLRWMDY